MKRYTCIRSATSHQKNMMRIPVARPAAKIIEL